MVPSPTTGIQLVRLTSGEELIGDIEVNSVGDVYVARPAIVIIQPPRNQNEQMGVALIGWLPYTNASKKGVNFKREHVIFVVTPDDTMIKTYKERFTSDAIIVPQPDVKRASGLVIPGSSRVV